MQRAPVRRQSLALPSLFGILLLAMPAIGQAAEPKVDLKKLRGEARAAVQSGDWEVAVANYRKVVAVAPDDGASWQLLGYSLHAQGKLDEALPIHQKAAEFQGVAGVACYNAACVFALKGKTEEAFAWLDKAVVGGFDRPEHIEGDSDMDALRKDPRFQKILDRIHKQAAPDRTQVFVIQTERKNARVAWFNKKGSPGQIAIDYTPVAWQAKYDEAVAGKDMLGKKWRFGADFWTTLDTSIDLTIGSVVVPAGYYYLTLEQREPGKMLLALHDAAAVKKLKIDAYQAEKLQGGIEVPLAHEKSDDVAKNLKVGIEVAEGSQDHGEFVVHFGGHQLRAPVLMKVGG